MTTQTREQCTKNENYKNISLHTHMYPSNKETFFQVLFKIQLLVYNLSQLDPIDTM